MRHELMSGRAQRGAATLITVMGLTAACAVALGFMARALGTEHRGLSDRWRWAVAREAAESGQQWARAQLNAGRLNALCQPSHHLEHPRWVDHRPTASLTILEAALQGQATTAATPPVARCEHTASAWQCQCAHQGGTWGEPASTQAPTARSPSFTLPRFEVALQPASTPHTLIVHTWGCTGSGGSCSAPEPGLQHVTHLQTALGFVPHLRVLPRAALTVHGNVRWAGLPTSIRSASSDSSNVLVRTAGSWISSSDTSPTDGSAQALASISTQDRWLQAALTGDAALSKWLGWRTADLLQSGQVQRLDCAVSQCAQQLLAAWSRHPDTTWWIDNPLVVHEPIALGSAQHPLLLIINGDLQLQSPDARLQGVVLVRAATSTLQGPGSVDGAVVVLGDTQTLATTPPPALIFNAELVQRVRERHGLWAPIPGSWRDY